MSNDPQPSPEAPEEDPGYLQVRNFLLYGLSLPERTLRSATGVVSGTLRESTSLLVPQAFQNSRVYTTMVRQMLDFLAEDIGGVERAEEAEGPPKVENYVARKVVGNFIELSSFATFHLSPFLLLAIVSDVAYGSQAYLHELAGELKAQGVIAEDSTVDHVDDLLAAVGAATNKSAASFDTPPLSVEGLKQTISQTREAIGAIDPTKVLPQAEIKRLWDEMHELATSQGVNPLAISGAVTLYTLNKIGAVGRGAFSTVKAAGTLFDRHVIDHYQEAIAEIHKKGLYATLAETSQPYIAAVWANFSTRKTTITENLLTGRLIVRGFARVRGWFRRGKTPPETAPGPPEPQEPDGPERPKQGPPRPEPPTPPSG